MGPLDQFNHLFNFFAPAIAVGVLLALLAPLFYGRGRASLGTYVQAAINSVAGGVALGVGLWFFGHDGKIASYAAMLLASALSQGWSLRR
ncbi:MAG: hypothetical protein WCK83_10210 [Burkholderiales bacterium]|nr:hypothetical protein [Burkholderiales bacterium]